MKRKQKHLPKKRIIQDDIQSQSKSILSEKYHEYIITAILLAFGTYLSFLYFGHKVVPNSDFGGFVASGQNILDFDYPTNFKRVPMLGIMQITLNNIIYSGYSILSAGWLLNAILFPFILVLLYKVAKEVLSRSALWFALIAIINPYTVSMLVEPIVEITLIFYCLLTLFLIFKNSRWCYLFAALATMSRYEGAALIVIAIAYEMITSKDNKQRIKFFLCAVIASLPLILWMIGTFMAHDSSSDKGMAYIRNYGKGTVITEYIQLLWTTAFMPLTVVIKGNVPTILDLSSKIIASIGLLLALGHAIYKKNWKVLTLFTFFILYFIVHATKNSTRTRYCIPVAWLLLLLCWYGFQSLWQIIKTKKIPAPAIIILKVIAMIILAFLTGNLTSYLTKANVQSPNSSLIPYIFISANLGLLAAYFFCHGKKNIIHYIAISSMACFMAFSSQFTLIRTMGTGQRDAEFKELAYWYQDNAKDGQKILTTLPSVTSLYAQKNKKAFVHTVNIKAKDRNDFVMKCYQKNITYVAWDSRLGFSPKNTYYRRWGLKNIDILIAPKNNGPYEFLHQIKNPVYKNRFINIFRLRNKPQQP